MQHATESGGPPRRMRPAFTTSTHVDQPDCSPPDTFKGDGGLQRAWQAEVDPCSASSPLHHRDGVVPFEEASLCGRVVSTLACVVCYYPVADHNFLCCLPVQHGSGRLLPSLGSPGKATRLAELGGEWDPSGRIGRAQG